MDKRFVSLAGLIMFLMASGSTDLHSSADADMTDSMAFLPPEVQRGLERYLLEFGGGPKPGIFLRCEDYLTEIETEDYCSSNVPNGWRQFEYNGEIYYIQPLSKSKQ